MAKNRGGKPPPSGGALIGGGAPTPPAPARTAKDSTIDRLLSMLSIWPFRNKGFVRSLETAQEVVEKQNKLEETIIQHGRTRERLNDLEITLAQDRLQRRREFIEEREKFSAALNASMLDGELMERKNKMKKEELTIEEIELKTRKAKAQKDLEELNKASDTTTARTAKEEDNSGSVGETETPRGRTRNSTDRSVEEIGQSKSGFKESGGKRKGGCNGEDRERAITLGACEGARFMFG
jgi:hypothetical protein